ncbi:MAG: sigma-70 family RNA polymerase sigma factor [Phycisphaeraceae bacterium]
MHQRDLTLATDQSLLIAFRRTGDHEIFAEIVRRYADAVYATCRRVLRDAASAEDAAQDTFFRLLQQRAAVERSLGGWLHRTATRLAIDAARSRERRRRRELSHARQRADAGPAETAWHEASAQLDAALAGLPDDAQWLLIQHFIRQRSLREIARENGSSPATLSRHLRAAIDRLRAELQRRGVTTTAAALLATFGSDAAVAAPAPLLAELGKMTLYSAGTAARDTTAAASLLARAAAGAALGLAGMLLVLILVFLPARSGPVEADLATLSTPPSVAQQPGGAGYITLPGDGHAFDSQKMVLVQDPATATDDTLTVVFGDNRTVRLPTEEVRRRIERQTGQTFEQIISASAP